MNIKFDRANVHLDADRFLKLEHSRGTQVKCTRGSLWITQDDDTRDYVLGPGQVLELEHGGDALVFALMDSDVMLASPQAEPSPLDRAGKFVVAGFEGLGNWIASQFGPGAINTRKGRGWYGAL